MTATFNLYWTSEDCQSGLNMGEYATRADAESAIPAAKRELLSQCGEDEQRAGIEDGSWFVIETDGE